MKEKVAIQGIKGSNHYKVATDWMNGYIDVEECLTFDALADLLEQDKVDKAIMAIENSIAGSILPNYAIIDHRKFQIVGEYYLNIHHHLMALPGQKIEEIKEVASHPMALLQCKKFLRQYPHIRLVEDLDTAETALRIHEKQLKGLAAIAPAVAAELYDLEIIAENIQSIDNNATRFVLLQKENHAVQMQEVNKASLRFVTDHKRGSLATVLNVMSDCNMNMTKIQSMPIIDNPWQYAFFVDVTFSDYAEFEKAQSILPIMCKNFKVLGAYKSGNK